jgi:hypothetical protein
MSELRQESLIGEIGALLASHESLERPLRRRHSSSTKRLAEAVRELEEAARKAAIPVDCNELAPIALPADPVAGTEAAGSEQEDPRELAKEIAATIDRLRVAASELDSIAETMSKLPEDVDAYFKSVDADFDRWREDRVLTPEERAELDREDRRWRRRLLVQNSLLIPVIPWVLLIIVIATAIKLGSPSAPSTQEIPTAEEGANVH